MHDPQTAPNHFVRLTAAELRRGLHQGDWSCTEQTRALLEHAARVQPALNALTSLDEPWVMAQAQDADRRLRRGERHPWLGLPVTVKDNLWVADRRVTNGSALFRDFMAPRDAWAVARLRHAGAVVLGSTVCSEFACKGVTANVLHGVTRNPWDITRTPGGSSGGAAAALAAGVGALALCTDGGGSARRPGAHTGVVAMKPSAGCIPHAYGFREPVYGNSVVSLMARTVQDVEDAMAALVAPCADDPQSAATPAYASAPLAALSGLRVGFSPSLGLNCPVDSDVAHSVAAAVQRLSQAGCEIVEVDPDWPNGIGEAALMPLQHAGLAALYGQAWRDRAWDVDPDISAQIESGLKLDGVSVAHALEVRKVVYECLNKVFSQCDLLVTPTTPVTAWPLGQLGPTEINGQAVAPRAHAVFTPLFNHAYMPACSVPCGLDRLGLPIGLQIAGPMFADARVLALASWVQSLCAQDFTRPHLNFLDL